MTSSRSARGAVAAASDRLAGLFARVGAGAEGISPHEVLTVWPRVMTTLRTIREPDSAHNDDSTDPSDPMDPPADAGGSASSARHRGPSRSAQAMVSVARLRDVAAQIAPRLPIRDRPTMERHLKAHDTDRMADLLVRNASNSTAVAGSIGGFLVLPTRSGPGLLLAIPIRVAAETLVVAMIELKMIGELHEVYGRPLAGSATQRGTSALRLWASYRGLEISDAGGLVATLSQIARRPTTRRATATMAGKALGRRGIRVGAGVAGAVENRRATLAMGEQVRSELRRRVIAGDPGSGTETERFGSGTRLV